MEISKDSLFLILNKLDDKDLINYCQVDKKASDICNNQVFWYNRIAEKFPYIPQEVLSKYKNKYHNSWSDYYIKDLRHANLSDSKEVKKLNELLINYSKEGRLDFVMIVLNNGANIHYLNDMALLVASIKGNLDIVKYLIKKGVKASSDRNMAMRRASIEGHLDIVKFLVENGADVIAMDNYALKYAALKGHLDIVKYLIKKGANIHAENDYVIRIANQQGHEHIVKYLTSFY